MADKLRGFVHVDNPETGEREVFGPDDKLPKWARDAIDPNAFGSDEEETAGDYAAYSVDEAVAFLEGLTEEERESYFQIERDNDRKGVLKHFGVE